jgi:hypothetical protein
MNTILKSFIVINVLALSFFDVISQGRKVDICIYGGTSAGVIAAHTAKKLGKTVLLIEPGSHLGGLSSGGLGYTDIGNKYAVTGLARDFYRRIGKHYGKFEQWIFEPHVAEDIFKQYIKEANVEVLFNHRLTSVKLNSGVIESITLEHSGAPGSSTNMIVNAKIFIDCTYEGDLMARSGVSYTVGRESNSMYNETYNGVQLLNKHQFPDNIDPYKKAGNPESGLLWGISDEALQPQGSGDRKVQAYNFRICLTNHPANRIDITRPENYDSSKYELLLRLLEAKPANNLNAFLKIDMMPNGKTDINNNGAFSTDMIGINYDYPEANYNRRKEIMKSHEDYTKGFLYFVGHDPRMPAHLQEQMLAWGYPKDEYVDNNHWSHQMYVREARRMVGSYVMTQHNCQGREVVADGVGMAAYTMDSHNTQRIVVNGMVKNEGDVQMGGFPPYPISYRSIVPIRDECRNLLVPVCLSATHIAYGSIRMEPVFMVLGQSAATAAVQALLKNVSVQDVNIAELQQKLKGDPLVNGRTPEILINDDDSLNVQKTGNWQTLRGARGCYGLSMLTLQASQDNVGSVRFNAKIQASGKYTFYLFYPKVDNGVNTFDCNVFDGGRMHTVKVNPNQVKVEGQTSGEWIKLGEFQLKKGAKPYVEISSKGSQGTIVADAVLIVPN